MTELDQEITELKADIKNLQNHIDEGKKILKKWKAILNVKEKQNDRT